MFADERRNYIKITYLSPERTHFLGLGRNWNYLELLLRLHLHIYHHDTRARRRRLNTQRSVSSRNYDCQVWLTSLLITHLMKILSIQISSRDPMTWCVPGFRPRSDIWNPRCRSLLLLGRYASYTLTYLRKVWPKYCHGDWYLLVLIILIPRYLQYAFIQKT